MLHGQAWGELYLARTAELPVFTEADTQYATLLAAQISAGLAQTERLADLRRLAFTDPLTGLANRRAVDAQLEAALAVHNQDGSVVSLVVCDVNGLKRINDRHGHEMGDRLLQRFANQLSMAGAKLPGSLAARLGGDEFCLLAQGQKADEVVAVAEELCTRALQLADGEGVACGVASTGDAIGPVSTPDRLFRLADAAQYRAKAARAAHPVVAGRSHGPGLAPDPTVLLADSAEQRRTDGRWRPGPARCAGRTATGGGSAAPRTAPTRASCSPRCWPRWTRRAGRAPCIRPTRWAGWPPSPRRRPGCWTRWPGGSPTYRRAPGGCTPPSTRCSG